MGISVRVGPPKGSRPGPKFQTLAPKPRAPVFPGKECLTSMKIAEEGKNLRAGSSPENGLQGGVVKRAPLPDCHLDGTASPPMESTLAFCPAASGGFGGGHHPECIARLRDYLPGFYRWLAGGLGAG